MHVVALAELAVVGDVVEVDVDRRQARGIEDAIAAPGVAAKVVGADTAVEAVVAVAAEQAVDAGERRAACRCRRRR